MGKYIYGSNLKLCSDLFDIGRYGCQVWKIWLLYTQLPGLTLWVMFSEILWHLAQGDSFKMLGKFIFDISLKMLIYD